MTQSNQPNDRSEDNLARKIRDIDWRVRRLEASAMPASAIAENFQQVYDELDELHEKTDELSRKVDRVEGKIDTILQHITGMGGANPT